MAKAIYICASSTGFSFSVKVKNVDTDELEKVRVKFADGQFHTEDKVLAAAIDKAIAGGGAIGQRILKADKSAAEQMALEHMKRNSATGAHKGGVTSDAAKAAMSTAGLQDRDAALAGDGRQGSGAAAVDATAFAEDGLQLTEGANVPAGSETAGANAKKEGTAPLKLGAVS